MRNIDEYGGRDWTVVKVKALEEKTGIHSFLYPKVEENRNKRKITTNISVFPHTGYSFLRIVSYHTICFVSEQFTGNIIC